MQGIQLYCRRSGDCKRPGRWSVLCLLLVCDGSSSASRAQGRMTAMQAINTTAVEPGLMVPFWDHVGHIAVAITAISNWENGVSAWLLVGSLLRSRHLCSDRIPRSTKQRPCRYRYR